MKAKLAALGAVATLTFTAPALADDWNTILMSADTNSDGQVDMMEVMNFSDPLGSPGFKPFLAYNFKEMDTDGDGMVSSEEVKKHCSDMGLSDADILAMFRKNIYQSL